MKALFITLMILASPIVLSEEIGKLVIVKGPVELISADGTKSMAKKLQVLSQGDKLQTGSGGYVKLLMKDDSVFQVGPNSEFGFEKFQFETKNKRTAIYNLSKGQLRSWFVNKSPEKTLTIKTPTASMGIRGTEILTDVYQSEVGEVKTDIALVRGKLEVVSAAIGGKVMLAPGQLLDGLGGKLAGRAPASAREALLKNLPKKVFDAVRKNSISPNGAIFLHEARQKFGRENNVNKIFGANSGQIERSPASSSSAKERVRARRLEGEKDEIRKKLVNRLDSDKRNKIRQKMINNQFGDRYQEYKARQDSGSSNVDSTNVNSRTGAYGGSRSSGGIINNNISDNGGGDIQGGEASPAESASPTNRLPASQTPINTNTKNRIFDILNNR